MSLTTDALAAHVPLLAGLIRVAAASCQPAPVPPGQLAPQLLPLLCLLLLPRTNGREGGLPQVEEAGQLQAKLEPRDATAAVGAEEEELWTR